MADKGRLAAGTSDGRELEVTCQRCVGDTTHVVVSSATLHGSDGHVDWSVDYQILQCMGCKSVSFRSSATNSEEFHEDHDGERYHYEDVKLWPPRLAGFAGLGEDLWILPEKIRRIYVETSQALVGAEPVLTGIGVRAILETVCKDQHAAGSNLFKQIDDLVAKGILTPARAKVLHQIRTLGNQAAHEVEPHSSAQLALAMVVVDHLLEEVYVLPEKAARMFPAIPGSPALVPSAGALPQLPPLPLIAPQIVPPLDPAFQAEA